MLRLFILRKDTKRPKEKNPNPKHQITPRLSRASRDCGVSCYHSLPLKRDGTAGGAPPINFNARNIKCKAR